MSGSSAGKQRRQRTFSAFGAVRRMPSEYEIVTHQQNWTTRKDRTAAFEQNPSSPPNLWFLTYRDNSPLQMDDWDAFRDPDAMTYRTYVTTQAEAETKTRGALEEYSDADADSRLSAGQVGLLGSLFTPSRYLVHGCQQIQAYIGYLAPSSYITNPAGMATADYLRRLTLIGYRTRELQSAHPDSGIGSAERERWESHPDWQPARRAVEKALVAYDWGEAFTALNLVLAPTLDDVLNRQFKEVSRDNGDELSWLLMSYLQEDNDRRNRWSSALAQLCLRERPANEAVLRRWVNRWVPLADEAAAALGAMLARFPERFRPAEEVAAQAVAARTDFLDGVFRAAGDAHTEGRTEASALR